MKRNGSRRSLKESIAGAWLALVSRLVPRWRRDEWLREWRAELWHRARSRGPGRGDGRDHGESEDRGESSGHDARVRRAGSRDDPSASAGAPPLLHALGALPHALRLRRWSLDMLVQDLRYALRSLRRAPGFSTVAVLTVALGIGAATAIFSVVNAVIVRPLPFAEPDRLVMLWETNPERGWERNVAAPANFLDWRESVESFEDVTAHASWSSGWAMTGRGDPEWVRGFLVFGNFFDVLGVEPALGRGFRVEETWAGDADVVVLSHDLWRRSFGGDPEIVGSAVELDGTEAIVVGVMPAGFDYPAPDTEIWAPFGWQPGFVEASWFRKAHFVRPVARLAPGAGREAARAELEAVAARLERQYPETNRMMGAGLTPLHDWIVGDTEGPLTVLMAAVGVLLLVACANVANLLLARGAVRDRELAIRSALGAGRWRIVRLLLTESLILSAAGGLLGVLVGRWGVQLLIAVGPDGLPRLAEASLDGTVLAFCVAVSFATGLLFGLAPAMQGSETDVAEALKEGGRGASQGRAARRLRAGLVVGEVALAVALVITAGLLARSFLTLRAVDPGFEPENVLSASLELPGARYPDRADVVRTFRGILEEISRLPGVEAVGAVDTLPLSGPGWTSDFRIQGRPADEEIVGFHRRVVTPGYFEAQRVPLRAGRTFRWSDDAESRPVAVINDVLARRHFPDGDPVGQRISYEGEDQEPVWRTIVGVVGTERIEGLDGKVWEEIFVPATQLERPYRYLALVVRSGVEPSSTIGSIRSVVRETDPALPLFGVRTMEEVVAGTVERERFLALLLGSFAGLALALAAVGVYGVLSYAVGRRTREIGVRIALGAGRADVVAMVLREGLVLSGAGLLLGVGLALVAARWLESSLYGIAATDPATYALVAGCILATAALASAVPAWRAVRLDPVAALHRE